MKTPTLVAMLALTASLPATAQVIVNFANLGPGWSHPIFAEDGVTPLQGAAYQVELVYDATPIDGSGLRSISPAAGFVGGGLFSGGSRSIPIDLADPAAPDTILIGVRAWDSRTGPSFADALIRGESGLFSIPVPAPTGPGSPPPFPVSLQDMDSFSLVVVPEPAAAGIVLGSFLALGTLLVRLRARQDVRPPGC